MSVTAFNTTGLSFPGQLKCKKKYARKTFISTSKCYDGCGYRVCKYHNFPILMLCHLLQGHLKDKITAREQSVSTESSPKEEVTEEDRTGINCEHISA